MSEYYGSVDGGDAYFATRLYSDDWDNASSSDKLKSLYMATRLIDTLNFAGEKSGDLEFPRGDDTEVPDNIIKATYEISLKLLGGDTRESTLSSIGVTSNSWGTVKQTYDVDSVPEWTAAGVPSSEAWALLRPFLRDPTAVLIRRVS